MIPVLRPPLGSPLLIALTTAQNSNKRTHCILVDGESLRIRNSFYMQYTYSNLNSPPSRNNTRTVKLLSQFNFLKRKSAVKDLLKICYFNRSMFEWLQRSFNITPSYQIYRPMFKLSLYPLFRGLLSLAGHWRVTVKLSRALRLYRKMQETKGLTVWDTERIDEI